MGSSVIEIEGVLGMLTIKLSDNNYTKWFFQFKSMLKRYKLFDHFDGSAVFPPKFVLNTETGVTKEVITAFQGWKTTDMALLSLLIATLINVAIKHVIGCGTAHEA